MLGAKARRYGRLHGFCSYKPCVLDLLTLSLLTSKMTEIVATLLQSFGEDLLLKCMRNCSEICIQFVLRVLNGFQQVYKTFNFMQNLLLICI